MANAIYMSNWHEDLTTTSRNTALMVMARAGKVPDMSVLGLIDVNKGTFVSVSRKDYASTMTPFFVWFLDRKVRLLRVYPSEQHNIEKLW